MNREDIIRMAQDAGMQAVFAVIEEHKDGWKTVVDHRPFLERFAALVASAEREACAKVCEEIGREFPFEPHEPDPVLPAYCAEAIRARGKK